ncbi:SpaH/EbpB family LPXTG-anchored major pilin [Corynebacterium auris]|uniref:SpaH/EbpB family LPXTG-anchored major pilin n=1 Tax=Corynebacterium auris TaxID=44750 RepID=UPI0025B488A1|nr:SpaH/EbpB family LPXTG-anchored major pilin [Corynebacterium auris]WJY68833.1 Fimbrial subunit type 1 precursor [Corynebacterium auris]
MTRFSRKTLALAAAAAVAASTPLAFAQDTNPSPPQTPQNTQSINLNADVALIIDKRLGEAGAITAPLADTSFVVERVQLSNPLNTAAGWQEASAIASAGAADAPVTGDSWTETTGENGQAVFEDLTVGMYRVTEVQNGNYTVAAPFLVTLPLIEEGQVNYRPTIAPKNQQLEPTKAAEDTDVAVGEDIVYTIKAPVPAGDVLRDGTRTINQFRIVDQLQAGLTYNALAPARVTITGGPAGATVTEGEHYTLTWDAGNNTLTVDFTEAGRQQLAEWRASNPGLTVSVEFNATVTQIPANGRFENIANVYIPNAQVPLPTTPETEEDGSDDTVTTQYVNVVVAKTVNGENLDGERTGAGAVFQVYECTAQGGSYSVADGATALTGSNEAGNAAADAALTTEGGSAVAPAAATGYALQFDPEKQYCAVETQAPSGYLLNPDPTPLNLTTTTEAGRPVYTATVNDVRDTILGRLPATGERTMIILLALGLVLFAGGAAYQLRRKS